MANTTTAHAAAAEIAALINARPSSPRPEEIEAIIARTLAAPEPSDPDDAGPPILATWEARAALERWQRCLHDFLDRCKSGADTETDWAAIIQQSQIIWDRPVQSLDDVLLRAAVCIHWNCPGMATDPAYPDDIIADGPEGNMDNYATAMVMRGLLDLTGLQFDPEGRLLSVMRPEPWCKDE